MSSPDQVAKELASVAIPCTSGEIFTMLTDVLRKAQCIGGPNSHEPLQLFVTAGGVDALAKAMKANTPEISAWKDAKPEGGDLAEIHKEACGLLNNLAAAALADTAPPFLTRKALRSAMLVPILVTTVDAYTGRAEVLHRVLPALAQLTTLVPEQVEASDAIRVIVRCMEQSDERDAWIHCSAARVLNLMLQRGDQTRRALLRAGALGATMRALDASADEAKIPKGFGFTKEQLRQKLAAMGAPLLRTLSNLADELYKEGATGTLQGLAARADLNSAAVTVQRPKGAAEVESLKRKGRVKVQAVLKGESETVECLAVRYSNLVLQGDLPAEVS